MLTNILIFNTHKNINIKVYKYIFLIIVYVNNLGSPYKRIIYISRAVVE